MKRHSLAAIAFAAALAGPAAAAPPQAIDVHLSNFNFAPRAIVLDRGRDYVLTLVNDSGGGHTISAPAFFAASGLPAAERARLEDGREVEVEGHMAVTLHLSAPSAPATYKFKCTHSMHNLFGMNGTIIVR